MELIAALLHNPRILFLDEPTMGLDAAAQRQIRGFLREVNTDKKTTILLTSHYMEDVRSLCPRSVVINGGKKIYDGDTESLFNAFQTHKKINLSFDEATDFPAPATAEIIEQNPYRVSFMLPKALCSKTLAEIMGRYNPTDISVEEDDIGMVVERIYGG
jgi:ABC-2 type transport system ATP-binding protein